MESQLLAAVALILMLLIYGALTAYMRKRGIPIPGEEDSRPDLPPHRCPEGRDFMPVARTRALKIGEGKPIEVAMADSSGNMTVTSMPAEIGVVVCDGVFCSRCGKRLVCACGKTPTESVILDSEAERIALLSCCASPTYLESDVPDEETRFVPAWKPGKVPQA